MRGRRPRSPACPNAGVDSEMARVSASAVPGSTQWCGAAATVFTVTPSAPHWRPQPLASTRTPSATAASIVNSAAPAMPRVGTTNTRLPALGSQRLGAGAGQPPRRGQAALAPGRPRVLVEVDEAVRRRRCPAPARCARPGRCREAARRRSATRVDHLVFGLERRTRAGARRRRARRGRRAARRRARRSPVTTTLRPVMGRTSGEGGLRPPRRRDGVSGCERR